MFELTISSFILSVQTFLHSLHNAWQPQTYCAGFLYQLPVAAYPTSLPHNNLSLIYTHIQPHNCEMQPRTQYVLLAKQIVTHMLDDISQLTSTCQPAYFKADLITPLLKQINTHHSLNSNPNPKLGANNQVDWLLYSSRSTCKMMRMHS